MQAGFVVVTQYQMRSQTSCPNSFSHLLPGTAIEDFEARLRQLENQELRPLITISFITEISFSQSHEVCKIGAALLSKAKSAAPIIVPVPRRDIPVIGAVIIQDQLWPSVGAKPLGTKILLDC